MDPMMPTYANLIIPFVYKIQDHPLASIHLFVILTGIAARPSISNHQ